MKTRDLFEEGEDLFKKKRGMDCLWQDIAENFYPERATFTNPVADGEDFGSHLYSSYPLIARRELGDSFSTLSRPQGEKWHYMALEDEDREDDESREWMESKNDILRRINYNSRSRFVLSMKQGDHDWTTFGQCALSAELNRDRNGLLYRNWHLRDMAWTEGFSGEVDQFWRKWQPTGRQLVGYFGADKLHPDCARDDMRNKTIDCRHIFVPGEYADVSAPFVSIYYDVKHEREIEKVPYYYGYYVVPRWYPPSGTQYAYSPAMICALPDARLLQDITRVMLETGQKAVDPPMLAVVDALQSAIDIQPGGVTAKSLEYDERSGKAVEFFPVDKSGLGLGVDMMSGTQAMLAKALYLDKLNLPRGKEMTAYESSIRFQEYIRTILPVFEPKEQEMEGKIIQLGFDISFRHGAFGSARDMPRNMQGANYQFKFVSPLSKAIEEKAKNIYMEVAEILEVAAGLDPMAISNFNANEATRDAIKGTGANQTWLNDEDEVKAAQNRLQAEQQAQRELDLAQQAKDVISA